MWNTCAFVRRVGGQLCLENCSALPVAQPRFSTQCQLSWCVAHRKSTAESSISMGTHTTRRLGEQWVVTLIQACTHTSWVVFAESAAAAASSTDGGCNLVCFPSGTYVFVMQITETKLQARARLTLVPTRSSYTRTIAFNDAYRVYSQTQTTQKYIYREYRLWC